MSPCNQAEARETVISALLGSDLYAKKSASDESIYIRLEKYLTEPDESLDPSPDINETLSELVSLLQGSFRNLQLVNDACFADVARKVCDDIDENKSLRDRANAIRSIAIRSETRLELYWAYHLARSTAPINPALPTIEKIREGSGAFPYVENYIRMVQTEAKVIRAYLRQSFRAEYIRTRPIRVAFCGSGPLPLTGILLSVCLKANVILIDKDQESVDLSQKLIKNWEERDIIPIGMVNVMCADGGHLIFTRNVCRHSRQEGLHPKLVECDVLFVAALIPNQTKEEIARNIAEMRNDGPLVVMRTAHGLTARFAYFQNRRSVIERYLNFIGLVVPEVHEYGDGHIVDDNVKPIGYFPKDILNSLELFE